MKPFLLLAALLWSVSILCANDSIRTSYTHFIAVNSTHGHVLESNDFVSGSNNIPYYTSYALKFGLASKGDNWMDYAYGLPTIGIGAYVASFGRKKDIGVPFSVYLFQGAKLKQLSKRASLHYEWDLGASVNWKHYDTFDNPNNVAIGSTINVHVGGNLFVNWQLSKKWDMSAGVGFTHFSNGASAIPNKGLNMLNAYIELAYYLDREELPSLDKNPFTRPTYQKRVNHDVMLLITQREMTVDTVHTSLPDIYLGKKFQVLGVSYAYMMSNNYRYKWGPSLELTYDEGSRVKAWRELHPETQQYHDRIKRGPISKRFSAGLSLKGEISMHRYSIFANLGYDIIHPNKYDERFYQIIGTKIYLAENLFATFGIRATRFGSAQYLYWNLGYSFEQFKKQRTKQ